ncbi:DMT family transporter [Natrarchaeobius oligotrophus]|uniref:DMT family transporter n=1 Tax=Natrarchaeobius chitinivorans TaxID=1679083 RepID=A0A3N6NKV6_NATCH|nr:DMT family transporter [Natrarchaeobius chitinivorans]RQG99932.1 DMT family transporter [Natrarchaeobius chitinivorans]
MDRRTLALFAISSLLFGGTFVAAKAGLEYVPPLLFVALRFDVAAVVVLGYVLATTARAELVPKTSGDVAAVFATGVLVIGLTNAFLFVGQQYATSAVAAIVFSLNPVLTPAFAAVILADERLSIRGATGIALGLVGVALVVGPDSTALLGGDAIGTLVLFAGATSAALGVVAIRRVETTLSSTVRLAWGLPLAAALSHALSLSAGESIASVTWTAEAVIAIGYLALFAGAIAYVAYFALLEAAGAIRTNLVFYVVPVVSALGGWALLGEAIEPLALVGFAFVFVGFAVLESDSIGKLSPHSGVESAFRRSTEHDRPRADEEPRGYRAD